MNRFLRETWELFYWAMFFPSKLQQRMNEWCPAEEKDGKRPDTNSWGILLSRFNFRFVAQYFLLLLCLTLPLIINISINNQAMHWLEISLVLLIAYCASFWFLPIGLSVPLIFLMVYLQQPNFLFRLFNTKVGQIPTLSQLVVGIVIGIVLLIITDILISWSLKSNRPYLLRAIYLIGGTLSVFMGIWLVTKDWPFILTLTGFSFIGFLSPFFESTEEPKTDNDKVRVGFGLGFKMARGIGVAVAVGVALGVALVVVKTVMLGVGVLITGGVVGTVIAFMFILVVVGTILTVAVMEQSLGVVVLFVGGIPIFFMVPSVALVVAGTLAGVASLSLPLFILICILVAFSLASAKPKWLGIITAGLLTTIGFEKLGLNSLLTIPITLVFYYRLFPDYLCLTAIRLLSFSGNPLQILKPLPPHTTELLWLPLPNHDRILASAFRQDASAAMETFKQMQTQPLPGFQSTIKQALPQIIADQLTNVKTFAELVSIAKPEHPLLPLLIPTFYQSDSEQENAHIPETLPYIKAELSIIFPRLKGVSRDIDSTLKAGNAAFRERRLKGILESLATLSIQLPALGLKQPEIKRWEPVITRWQRVIKIELEEQQKQFQGEKINPFQFGNPVHLKRDYLFKGRQKFAEDIVRRILNSDRPTLILYGPRRCGKTSFLYNLPRLFPSDVLPVFLDMQSAAITTSEADFCHGLVRAIYKDSKSQGVLLPRFPKRNEFQESPYTVLEDWLDEALEKLEDRQILLNIDEFENIGKAISERRMTLQLFNELRHLIQHYDQLGFLFSGVKTLNEIGPHWSSYFISVVPIKMLYLEPEEARELLLDPDPEFTLRYDEGIVEEVLKLTRCQPYLLQLLGASMVTQANLHHTDTITKQLLEAAIEDGFIQGEPYFTNVWTEFTGKSEAEILAGQTLLINLAKGEQPNTDRDDITEAALQYMLRHHILEERDSQYNFEIPLVKMWVKER